MFNRTKDVISKSIDFDCRLKQGMSMKFKKLLVAGLALTISCSTQATDNNCQKIKSLDKAVACVIYYESRGEPFIGKVSTGWVVVNRLNSEDFPKTPSAVVKQKGAFTWYNPKKSHVASHDPSWKDSLAIAHAIVNGDLADPTDGALFFEKCRKTPPSWYRNLYGDHCFREVY